LTAFLVYFGQIRAKEATMIAEKKKITKDSIIGDVIKMSPGAKGVIQKYFGNGCFTCPGINMESISFGSMMHNLDPNKIVDEINALEE
jgi:hybrid cluster-associated redox disulfide protein